MEKRSSGAVEEWSACAPAVRERVGVYCALVCWRCRGMCLGRGVSCVGCRVCWGCVGNMSAKPLKDDGRCKMHACATALAQAHNGPRISRRSTNTAVAKGGAFGQHTVCPDRLTLSGYYNFRVSNFRDYPIYGIW